MAKSDNLKDLLTDVADAIRAKKGTTDLINPQDFSAEIASIQTGGGSEWTGHADVEGLKAIGWDDADIDYFQKYGVHWNEEYDEYYKVSDENKALYGVATDRNLSLYKEKIIYLPKIEITKEQPSSLFSSCINMIGVPMLDTSKVTSMTNFFHSCKSLTYLPPLDTSKVTSMANFCYNCVSLRHIPMCDTSKVNDFSAAFFCCYSLKDFPEWDMSAATTTYRMFYSTNGLANLPRLNLSTLISFGRTFYQCYALKTIKGLTLNTLSSASNASEAFYMNQNLENVFIDNLSVSVDFSNSYLLSKESLVYMIKNSNESAAGVVITLHASAYERLANDPDVLYQLQFRPDFTLASAA